MGEVVDVGPEVTNIGVGDRVVAPFCIGCGRCWFCRQGQWSLCDNSNPLADGPAAYGMFHKKRDACIKVVLHPNGA